MWWVEALVVGPARLVGVGFGCVREGNLVRVDSRQLADLLPCPVGVAVSKVLYVAVAMGNIETGLALVSHHNT